MKNIFSSTTNLVLLLMTISLIALTFLKIMDPKDFFSFLGMVASYKFGRSQATKEDPVTPANTPLG